MTTVLAGRRLRLAVAPGVADTETVAKSPHPISEIRAFQIGSPSSANSYVVLQVRTESGLVGHGECNTLTPAELNMVNAAVKGRAATSYQVLDKLVPPAIRGGLNIALLDVVGKATKAPIYRILGGPTRNKARAITRLNGSSDAELQNDLQKQLTAGYRAFLIPVPEPTARNQGSDFAHLSVARMKAMRTAAPNADFAFEGNDTLTPGDASSFAADVEGMHPLWFDEPCSVTNIETIHKIADETVVPLAFGRTVSEPSTFQDLLREGVIDLLRPDILVHGISGVRRLAAMSETYYVDVAPWHRGGRIADAAVLHAAASVPNFFIAESVSAPGRALPRDGFFELPKGPGLGIDIDENSIEGTQIS